MERHFCRVLDGVSVPITEEEREWYEFARGLADPQESVALNRQLQQLEEEKASLSEEIDRLKASMADIKSQRKAEVQDARLAAHKRFNGEMARAREIIKRLEAAQRSSIAQMNSLKAENEKLSRILDAYQERFGQYEVKMKKVRAICVICGGDGGAGRECYRCGGDGWMNEEEPEVVLPG